MENELIFTEKEIVVPAMSVESREVGAVVEFWGIVREKEGEELLKGLRYEAYLPMAERVMGRHFKELSQRWPCKAVTMVHRLGWVAVGEASLYLRVCSSHRVEAIGLMGDAIDRLKLDVPVWKIVE